MIDNIHIQIEYLSKLLKTISNVEFLNDALVFESDSLSTASLRQTLTSNNIQFENTGSNYFRIPLQNIANDFIVYYDTEDFLNRFKENYIVATNEIKNNFAILSHNSNYFIYDAFQKIANSQSITGKSFLVSNTQSYIAFQTYLCSNEFAEYYNTAQSEIVFYSNTKGIYHLKVPRVIQYLDETKNYETFIKNALKEISNKEYKNLFKNELFDFVKPKVQDGFIEIIKNLESIISETNRNYDIYLKQFSFDNLKNELQKKKEEYFNSTREILSKVFGQVVSIPISVSASVFASYNVSDTTTLWLIFSGFMIYSIFVTHILLTYLTEVKILKVEIEKQIKKIKDESGLPLSVIEKDESIIAIRIQNVISTVIIFLVAINLLGFFFSYFISNKLQIQSISLITIILIQLLVTICLFGYSNISCKNSNTNITP